MGTTEEGGFRHSAMVDGGIWGGIEGRGVPLAWGVPELVVGYAHGLREVYRVGVVSRLGKRAGC